MKKINTLIGITALAFAFSLPALSSSFADPEPNSFANLENETVSASASHFSGLIGGDGINAGAVASATGKLKGHGRVRVDVSSSWDWSGFRSSEDSGPPEREVHRCALVNTSPHTFSLGNAVGTAIAGGFCTDTPSCIAAGVSEFTTDDTVTVTRVKKNGEPKDDRIDGKIRGGSVCEIVVDPGPPCTTNESMTAFEITGGTGKYSGATGSGLIHSVFNFCTGEFELNELFLRLLKAGEDDD